MFESRIKDLSELPDLFAMERGDHGMPRNWAFCRGGEGLERDQWAIQHVHEDLSQDLYPLPRAVSVLIQWQKNAERSELQRSLCMLLGLQD